MQRTAWNTRRRVPPHRKTVNDEFRPLIEKRLATMASGDVRLVGTVGQCDMDLLRDTLGTAWNNFAQQTATPQSKQTRYFMWLRVGQSCANWKSGPCKW